MEVSRAKLLQDRKFWAKNDQMLLGDFSSAENPQDNLKVFCSSLTKKKEVAEKALTKDFTVANKDGVMKHKTAYRWTETYLRHKNGGKRIFDSIKPARVEQ